jgi:hypothetical protein
MMAEKCLDHKRFEAIEAIRDAVSLQVCLSNITLDHPSSLRHQQLAIVNSKIGVNSG